MDPQEKPQLLDVVHAAAAFLRAQAPANFEPSIALVLGTGFEGAAARIQGAVTVPFSQVDGMAQSTMFLHEGSFVMGTLGNHQVVACKGRLHAYEGYSAQQVALPVWIMQAMGATTLITTNAAGGIGPELTSGDYCIMEDMVNFMGHNPIVGSEAPALKRRFFTLEQTFDEELMTCAQTAAQDLGLTAQRGIYLGLLGPNFETPAEIRIFKSWGISAVAMSAIEEILAAKQMGMRVLGISLISDKSYDGTGEIPNSSDVLKVLKATGESSAQLIEAIVAAQ